MKDTFKIIKDLKLKIEKITIASKQNNHVIEEMILQTKQFPDEIQDFVSNLPNSVITRINQTLDEEFEISLQAIDPQRTKSLSRRIPRGIRI
ncbi:MAG: hypothetical protein ACI843_000279 [Psychrobacter glaciei]|jgi:hypothetical protein